MQPIEAFLLICHPVGGEYAPTPLPEITTEQLRRNMNIGFEANFCRFPPALGEIRVLIKLVTVAYRDTIGYLLEQKNPATTWTICTGAQGDFATFPVPAFTQGALFPFATAGARENESTTVRFNELYLAFRVEVDESAVEHGVTKASDFANVYESILATPEVRSSRVRVDTVDDIKKLKYQKKF